MALLLVLSLLTTSGCSVTQRTAGGPAAAAERPDPSLLEEETLRRYSSAFEAVQTLRSQWLRVRSPGSFQGTGQVWVYRNGVRVGGVEELRRMSTTEIESIRYYDGRQASQRWGLGHENGVIFVTGRG